MKKFLFIIAFLCSIFSWGQSVIISQYIETISGTTPKGIEIFNITGSDIVFSGTNNLEVYQGTNGAACSSLVSITSGTLQAGKVWVVGTSDLTAYTIANGTGYSGTTTYGFSFNGDDALQVYLGGVLQDAFGTCGVDPGSAWSGGGVSTEGYNLEIKVAQSCSGNPSGFSDPSIRYNQIANGSTMTGFGNAPAPCGSPVPEINVRGNSVSIVDGNITPTTADHTDFGSVLTSTSITRTFTIQNLGTANLILPSNPVTLSNTTNGFSVTQPVLLTIPAGSSTTFTVTFNSGTAGVFNNTVNIANNDSDENPYDYAIRATAVLPTPEINLAKDTSSSDIPSGSTASTGYNTIFAALNIGSNSNKTYYIENEGTANLTIGAVTITGANPGDFSISAIPSTIPVGSTLGSSVSFTVTFTPQASGTRTATITIVNNDSNENPYTFEVQGTGNCPSYSTTLSPSSGPIGSTVFITSTMNLSGVNTVTLGGTSLGVTVVSSSQISVVIPPSASTDNIIVTNFQGCSTTNTFTVLQNVTSGCEGGGATATEIFISEVTDANTGGLSYIELYNGTGTTKNLVTYSIQIFNNGGSTVGSTVALPTFSLASGSTYVVAVGTGGATCSGIPGADASYAGFSSGVGGINFNVGENDHIKLYNGVTEVDRWGTYLSATWADGLGLGTEGANFKRKSTATAPSLTYNGADWDILNWASCANNDYSGIGTHNYSAGVPPVINTQPVYAANCGSVVLATTATEGSIGGLSLAYQWYVNAAGSGIWTTVSNGGVYSGATSASLSISSTSGLNDYQYYCQVRENSVTCYTATNVVKIKDDITTWNGSVWSNGVPTLTKKAILNGNYTTAANGNFQCCILEVNATRTLTVSSAGYVVINFNIINNGNISVLNNGSIVQINETNTNSGTYTGTKFQVNRIAQARNLDYIYWSSPVEDFAVSSLPGSNRLEWSPTATNANSTQGNWLGASGNMTTAKGYIAKASNGSATAIALPIVFQGGEPNNGSLSIGISRGNTPGTDDTWNLVGNPYPSAMSAFSFLSDNPNIEGSVRLWTHGSLPSVANSSPFYQNFSYNYSDGDYIVSNGTGSTTPGVFDGNIASGQGFFVRMLEDGETDVNPPTNTITAASSSVIFKNAHRRTATGLVYDNSSFYRNANNSVTSTDISRIWLDLISPTNELSRTLIGYVPGATLAKDRMFDALIEVEGFKFYSLINTQKQTIQGRPIPFNSNDLVPIGMFAETAGNYTVAISSVDGLFSDVSQNIYLEDKLLNIIHNLKQAPYTFSTMAGEFNERFVLRYTNTTLNNQQFENASDFVIVTNEEVSLSASENIKSVLVFDVLGRKIYEKNNINATTVVLDKLMSTKKVLIIKTTFDNGQIVTEKVLF